LIGTSEPYATSSTVTPSSGPTTTSATVSFIDVGVKLHVTPTIHDDGFVTMKIKPEISSEEPTLYPVPNSGSIPIVDTSEVQTTVRVKDGVTIIIGGLMKDELTNSKTQVPILGDLPIIGKAFRTEDRNVQKTEIVIFLTPHIINGDVHTDPEDYIKSSPTLKKTHTYSDYLPRDDTSPPVP
jgi:general secretion pathway protein D